MCIRDSLYYDRKLIARLEKEQERAAQQNK